MAKALTHAQKDQIIADLRNQLADKLDHVAKCHNLMGKCVCKFGKEVPTSSPKPKYVPTRTPADIARKTAWESKCAAARKLAMETGKAVAVE